VVNTPKTDAGRAFVQLVHVMWSTGTKQIPCGRCLMVPHTTALCRRNWRILLVFPPSPVRPYQVSETTHSALNVLLTQPPGPLSTTNYSSLSEVQA